MNDQIKEYLDLLTDNNLIAKIYAPDGLDETFNPKAYDWKEEEVFEKILYRCDELSELLENEEIGHDLLRRYELNGYQNPFDLEDFLITRFEKFKNDFINNNYHNDKNIKKEITNQVRINKYQLDNILSKGKRLRDETFDTLLKVKIEICSETLRFLNFNLGNISTPLIDKPLKVRKPIDKLTILTQNQIIILFHYLKQLKCIGNNMPKNLYASQISELTGFDVEKLRQALSHIDKKSTSIESIKFSETDYHAVRRILDKVISAINADLEEKFPSK